MPGAAGRTAGGSGGRVRERACLQGSLAQAMLGAHGCSKTISGALAGLLGKKLARDNWLTPVVCAVAPHARERIRRAALWAAGAAAAFPALAPLADALSRGAGRAGLCVGQRGPWRTRACGRRCRWASRMAQRLTIVRVVLTVVFAVLLGRLVYLQVMCGAENRRAAEENRLRIAPRAAPRGVILDRTGRVLATSRVTFSVHVVPDELKVEGADDPVAALAELLGESPSQLARALAAGSPSHGGCGANPRAAGGGGAAGRAFALPYGRAPYRGAGAGVSLWFGRRPRLGLRAAHQSGGVGCRPRRASTIRRK